MRHCHAAAAGGQSPAAPVSPDARPGRDQPHGFQQWRHGRCRGQSESAHGAGHRRHQYRRQQGQHRPHRRLRHLFRTAVAAGRLRHGECFIPQHAGPARAARQRRTDAASGLDGGGPQSPRLQAAAAENRARPGCERDGRDRRCRARQRHRRADRLQHHHRAAGAGLKACGRNRRPVRQTVVCALHHRAARNAQQAGRQCHIGGRGRHRIG